MYIIVRYKIDGKKLSNYKNSPICKYFSSTEDLYLGLIGKIVPSRKKRLDGESDCT